MRRFNPLAAWLAWLVLIASLALVLDRRLHLSADLTAFLPASSSPAERLLVAQLRDGLAARLILIGVHGDDPARLTRTSRALADRLPAKLFELIANGELSRQQADRDVLFAARYLLSPQVTARRFEPSGLHEAIQTSEQLFGSPAGALIRATLPRDPTGEFPALLAARFAGAGSAELRDGVWYDAEHARVVLIAQTRAAGYDLDAQRQAQQQIRQAFAATESAGVDHLLLSGPGVFAVESRAAIEHDAHRLTIAATLGVIMILALAYRSARLLALSLVPVMTGVVCAISAVALAFDPVHAVTLGFGATLIGEAVDYPTYLFVNRAAGESLADAARRIRPSLWMAVATTVVGSLAMLASSFAGLAQLGLFTLVGVLTAGLTTHWLLPRLAPGGFTAPARGNLRAGAVVVALVRRLTRLRWAVPLALAGGALSIAARGDALFEHDLAAFNPIEPRSQQIDQQLRDAIGAPDVRNLLMIEAADREQVLQRAEALEADLHRWIEQGLIRGFDAPSRYLPSLAEQRKRQQALPEPAPLRAALAAAVRDSAFRDDMFEPFIDDVEQARRRKLLEPADFAGTAWGQALSALLIEQPQRSIGLIPLQGVADPQALARVVSAQPREGVLLVDLKTDAERLIARYLRQSLVLTGFGVLLIALVLAVGLRSLSAALSGLLPVLGAVGLTITLLIAAGVKLSLLHVIALLLVTGIGVNYSLFFMRRDADRQAAEARAPFSALVACATSTLAFGVLVLSDAVVLRTIGSTVAIGASASWFFAAAWLGAGESGESVDSAGAVH